ncbi:MAG TPA: 2-dehydro-3-deoxygalactonokinase [Chitinophagaceae bacterium]|nr:2-dehydro-3-deoxygalactonokinase [Chitinophagaceae bacterium]
MNKYFYSCDWGTTNLRLRLVEASNGTVVSGIETDQGIAKIFSQWKLRDVDRFSFYTGILQECISKLKTSVPSAPGRIPIIISGMASSNIGMSELAYAELPVGIDGTGLSIQCFESSGDFSYPIILISGVRTNTDFMRGEEVQVIGACQGRPNIPELFILPGTHSKHVRTHDNRITDLKTYMTGELFQLLAVNSILSGSLELTDDSNTHGWENFFEEGIMQSLKTGILENLFGLRVAYILNQRTSQQNRYYLNGLLIGSELKNLTQNHEPGIVLVGNELQKVYYSTALEMLKVRADRIWISPETATVNGHNVIFKKQFDDLIFE